MTSGANSATYAYATNSALVDTITYKNSSTTRLTTAKVYDKLNRLASVTSTPSVSAALSHAYDYNAANQRTRVTRENSAYWSYGYDSLGQVTSGQKFSASNAALPGHDFAWTYDDIGNRKTAVTNGQTATYTSTSLNQYSGRTVPGAVDVLGAATTGSTVTVSANGGTPQASTRSGELFFQQLAVDNASAAQLPAIKVTGVKNNVGTGGEDAVTEITKTPFVAQTPEGFGCDSDGNLTSDARWNYTWDGENRLIAMQTSAAAATAGAPNQKLEFTYDGQGRRVSKKVSNWTGSSWALASQTLFLYDGWNMVAELNALSSNAAVRTYVWGLDLSGSAQGAGGVGGLLVASDGTNTCFAAMDGNGNMVAYVTAGTGTTVASYDYNAFGETIVAEGSAVGVFPWGFSTKYAESESGLLYYGLRYYNSSRGRWLSRDPIEESDGENLYGFVTNDGINRLDLYGLEDAQADYVAKSFINGIPDLGSLKSWLYPTADINLKLFANIVGGSEAFNQNPTTDAKDGKYRLYTRVTIKASCCKDSAPTVTYTTDMDGGAEGPLSGTINQAVDQTTVGSTVKVHWKGWGRPNTTAPELGMQMIKPRTSRNIWHDVTITVSCKDGTPSFEVDGVKVSKFPSFRLWRDGIIKKYIPQGALSDLWEADPNDLSFVAP